MTDDIISIAVYTVEAVTLIQNEAPNAVQVALEKFGKIKKLLYCFEDFFKTIVIDLFVSHQITGGDEVRNEMFYLFCCLHIFLLF